MRDACSTIAGTNSFVLKRHAEALSTMLGMPVRYEGLTDLAIEGKKFSGNSQRRRLRYLMFHGTFLTAFDLNLMNHYLRSPSKEPAYRGGRPHDKFLMNIRLTSDQVKDALKSVWNAGRMASGIPDQRIENLVQERYGAKAWNLKL
jgi:lipoate-protein ligase A